MPPVQDIHAVEVEVGGELALLLLLFLICCMGGGRVGDSNWVVGGGVWLTGAAARWW